MKYGLTSEELRFLEDKLKPLKDLGATIFLYGSRARGDYAKFSDIDLMVESSSVSSELRNKVEEIKEELSKSNFPYKVDIVFLLEFSDSYRPQYEKDKLSI